VSGIRALGARCRRVSACRPIVSSSSARAHAGMSTTPPCNSSPTAGDSRSVCPGGAGVKVHDTSRLDAGEHGLHFDVAGGRCPKASRVPDRPWSSSPSTCRPAPLVNGPTPAVRQVDFGLSRTARTRTTPNRTPTRRGRERPRILRGVRGVAPTLAQLLHRSLWRGHRANISFVTCVFPSSSGSVVGSPLGSSLGSLPGIRGAHVRAPRRRGRKERDRQRASPVREPQAGPISWTDNGISVSGRVVGRGGAVGRTGEILPSFDRQLGNISPVETEPRSPPWTNGRLSEAGCGAQVRRRRPVGDRESDWGVTSPVTPLS
jgi:hypothetical protein